MKRKLIVALGLAVIMALSLICLVACGTSDNEHVHTWATEWSHDGAEHWHACGVDGCDERNEVAAHSGGTATCKTKAKCAVCGVEYGELNGENHESTEFTYTANSDGTHKKVYKCCGAVVEANEACSGGTATCKTKAVCEHCGGEYGELNAENHESTEFTYNANNDGTHKKMYKCCGATAATNEACSGGTATCVAKAVCTLCGGEYGELSTEHVWATELSHDETNHWYACTVVGCTAKKDDAEHLGGTATCKTKATCSACGTVYGELNGENHESAEFTYTANNDGTHKKMHKCCGAVVEANEACSGGTATCVAKAICTLCGGEYGELSTAHAYANGLDTTNEVYDYKKCVCGKLDLEHGFKKTVDNDNQQLVMTSEAIALNLEGVSAYDVVKSITLDEANLGTNVNALELGAIKTDEKQHGAKQINVIVTDADGADHEVIVNVILVTMQIHTEDDLKTALYFGQAEASRYGYFTLESDIVYTGVQNKAHFYGVFEGNGHTVTTTNMNNGLFSYIYSGSVVRNLTIKATLDQGSDYRYKCVLAGSLWDKGGNVAVSTIENVTVLYEGGIDSADIFGGGFLVRGDCTNVVFKNLTVCANGKKIGSLLGQTLSNVTFENCSIFADEVSCVVSKADGTGKVGLADVEGLELKQIQAKEIALWQENSSLDYGDMFAGKTVENITCDNYSFGNNFAALNIPEELKADKQQHGNKNICVKFTDGSKSYLPVILVTAEITTEDEFKNAVMATENDVAKFGYYKLANDIIFASDVSGRTFFNNNDESAYGFRGTIDGQMKTLSTGAGKYVTGGGFFGLLGKGAVVKKLKINVAMYSGAYGLFASKGNGAIIQDVEITLTQAPSDDNRGVFVSIKSENMTYKNITLNAAGMDLVTIFGVNLGYGVLPTCENVVVNAKSLGAIGRKGWGGDPVTTLKGFTFNETLA